MELFKKYEKVFQGYHFQDIKATDDGMLITAENETGRGTIDCHHVFPGILLSYNDFHMESSFQEVKPVKGFLQINHCQSGCYEYTLEGGTLSFIGEGDLVVVDPELSRVLDSRFPVGRYEGISVMVELAPAAEWLEKYVPWMKLDLWEIRNHMRTYKGDALLLRTNASIKHIFDELYCVDEQVRKTYYILKILELFLFLSRIDEKRREYLPHFSQMVVEGTKAAYEFLVQNPQNHLTVAELSARFHVAETSLKNCFKAIYGQSPGAFVRKKRIQEGARLLIEFPEMTIGEISLTVGYENPSKFARAFKNIMGETPLSYRHKGDACLEQK